MTADRDYHTVPELASSLGVDQCKILGWIHAGGLRAIDVAERRGGRPRWRIPAAAWEDFQAARSNQATITPARATRRRADDSRIIKFY